LYAHSQQIGFARVVTDCATFAWLCDVFIIEDYRGQGLGKWLVECVVQHPELQGLRRMMLATRDAHELYSKNAGFTPLKLPEWMMERSNPAANNVGDALPTSGMKGQNAIKHFLFYATFARS
jgi:GNAT superfamily N-acetyltransferase